MRMYRVPHVNRVNQINSAAAAEGLFPNFSHMAAHCATLQMDSSSVKEQQWHMK